MTIKLISAMVLAFLISTAFGKYYIPWLHKQKAGQEIRDDGPTWHMAKQGTQLAPKDPLVLSYYGTCLFYAPKPFGSKAEALEWFEKADTLFRAPQWQYNWVREANTMYINQCKEKLKKQ